MDLDYNFNRNYNLYNISNNQKLNKMETIFKREKFDGYTHRFIVKLKVDNDNRNDTLITIYSNSDNYQKLENFIIINKAEIVTSFTIEHRASKEQDELTSKFIDDVLFGI